MTNQPPCFVYYESALHPAFQKHMEHLWRHRMETAKATVSIRNQPGLHAAFILPDGLQTRLFNITPGSRLACTCHFRGHNGLWQPPYDHVTVIAPGWRAATCRSFRRDIYAEAPPPEDDYKPRRFPWLWPA